MKVLVIHPGADNSVSDVHDGLVKGLRACGAEVGVVNVHDRIVFYSAAHIQHGGEWVKAFDFDAAARMAVQGVEVLCYEWWPDVVIVVTGMFVPAEVWQVLACRPHHTVLWATESPYEDDRQILPAEYADTVILNDPTNLEAFRRVNPRTFYMPHSYDPDRHKPGRATPHLRSDFAFVGTGFPSRIEFFEEVDWTGIDALLGGSWKLVDGRSPIADLILNDPSAGIDNATAAKIYRSAKVTANLYRKETSKGGSADGWAMGPREVELAACGSFFMREPRAEGDELFSMLPTFGSPVEFEEKLRWWLAHPTQRKAAADAARSAVADRTFYKTSAALLGLIEGHTKVLR